MAIRHDMIRDAIDISQLNLPQGKTTTKKWKTEKKLKSKNGYAEM